MRQAETTPLPERLRPPAAARAIAPEDRLGSQWKTGVPCGTTPRFEVDRDGSEVGLRTSDRAPLSLLRPPVPWGERGLLRFAVVRTGVGDTGGGFRSRLPDLRVQVGAELADVACAPPLAS